MRKLLIPLFVIGAAMAAPAGASAQDKSMALAISAPDTASVNKNVSITATLRDAWNNQMLAGRSVQFGIGEEFYLSNAGRYNTGNGGTVTMTWKFTRKGRYRIVAFVDTGSGYLSQRTLRFIEVR